MKRGRFADILLWIVSGLIMLFLIAPSLVVIPMSFSSADILSFPPPGFSLRWYEQFFGRPEWQLATRNSVIVGILATLTATLLGTAAALGLTRERVPLRDFVTTLFLMPMVVPVIVTAVAVYRMYARIELVGTIIGLVLAHTVLALPFVIINVSAVLQGLDIRIEHAARSLGATPLQTFRYVTLPLIRPGILAAALFAFLSSFDELVVALFISGDRAITLPVRMWSGLRFEINPTVAAISTILIALTLVVLSTASLVRRQTR